MINHNGIEGAVAAPQPRLDVGRDGMPITRIISSGTLGAESAALDAAIRFRIPYGGYTNQGALVPGDQPRQFVAVVPLLRRDQLLGLLDGVVPAPKRCCNGILFMLARQGNSCARYVSLADMDQARFEAVRLTLDLCGDFQESVIEPPLIDSFLRADSVDVLIQNARGSIPYGWPEGNALYTGPREQKIIGFNNPSGIRLAIEIIE